MMLESEGLMTAAGVSMDQNSLIMLSLDLPTPTHFTEMRGGGGGVRGKE